MNKEMKIDAVEYNDNGECIAMKGKMVNVYDVNELEYEFMSHQFNRETIKTLFYAQFNIDYCGG